MPSGFPSLARAALLFVGYFLWGFGYWREGGEGGERAGERRTRWGALVGGGGGGSFFVCGALLLLLLILCSVLDVTPVAGHWHQGDQVARAPEEWRSGGRAKPPPPLSLPVSPRPSSERATTARLQRARRDRGHRWRFDALPHLRWPRGKQQEREGQMRRREENAEERLLLYLQHRGRAHLMRRS